MELEEKINLSNESLDKLLNSKIQIKLILEYQNYIVVNNELELINIVVSKKELNKNNILNYIYNNYGISNIELIDIPFEKYNNYDLRYYRVKLSYEDITKLGNKFNIIDKNNIVNELDKKIVLE